MPTAKKECGQRGDRAFRSDSSGRQRRPDDDVAEMPRRVGRMQQREVVAPAARSERVEGGTGQISSHGRPRSTTPPPRLSVRALHALDPGITPQLEDARQRVAGVEVADARAEETVRPRPSRATPRDRAAAGRCRRRRLQRARSGCRPGTWNSSEAMRPPGRDDPSQLPERRGRIVDVAEEVGEGQRVEGCRPRTAAPRRAPRPGRFLGRDRHERCASPAAVEHLAALVDADDLAPVTAHELDRDRRRAGGDVEDEILGLAPRHARRGSGASEDPVRS